MMAQLLENFAFGVAVCTATVGAAYGLKWLVASKRRHTHPAE